MCCAHRIHSTHIVEDEFCGVVSNADADARAEHDDPAVDEGTPRRDQSAADKKVGRAHCTKHRKWSAARMQGEMKEGMTHCCLARFLQQAQ